MGFFIIIVGIIQMAAGVLVFLGSKSAIHEILGAISFGLGIVTFALAIVIVRLTDIKAATEAQLRIFEDRMARKAS